MKKMRLALLAASMMAAPALLSGSGQAAPYAFQTVANTGDVMPASDRNFNSFNQPSINSDCLVAFRARSKGPQQPVRGLYKRKVCTTPGPIRKIVAVGEQVPQPNNTSAPFNEFPAFPRMQISGEWVASRGQSRPVWEYTLPDGTDTRVGTSGIYVEKSGGALRTAESLLGAVPGFTQFSVPGAPAGTRFDQFPGAPSPTGGKFVTFKGNYTEGTVGKTGVYYRNVLDGAGALPTQLIANSSMPIPGTSTLFGSTSPPSASGTKMVFLGVDNEDNPTKGGIYLAPLAPTPKLRALATIGGAVPGVAGQTFNRLGEALSFDGRFVGYWGAWGTAVRTVELKCASDGNPDLIAACEDKTVQVPTNQGIFVHDLQTGTTRLIVRTGGTKLDFLFWVFSGRPPGVGDADDSQEPPRWRSSAFVALTNNGGKPATAFKALLTTGEQGIYVRPTPTATVRTVLQTGTDARTIDLDAPVGSLITALGVERDGFRGCRLALNASALNETTSESWAGIYVVRSGACSS